MSSSARISAFFLRFFSEMLENLRLFHAVFWLPNFEKCSFLVKKSRFYIRSQQVAKQYVQWCMIGLTCSTSQNWDRKKHWPPTQAQWLLIINQTVMKKAALWLLWSENLVFNPKPYTELVWRPFLGLRENLRLWFWKFSWWRFQFFFLKVGPGLALG